MKHFLMSMLFLCFCESSVMGSHSFGTVRKISEKDRGLSSYVRLMVVSYFQVETSSLPPEAETTCLLKRDNEKIARCRNGIALRSSVGSWFDIANFNKMSSVFRDVLQEEISGIRVYGIQSPNDEKLAIVVSKRFSWSEGIALIRKVYGEGDGRNVNIKTLEDSLFLIFLRILLPGFWDYPLSWMSESARKKKYIDEQFFTNCMESAITKYMEKVEKYDGPNPLDECERRYCSDFGVGYKEKMD